MNARIQVEHTVTEMRADRDLLQAQLYLMQHDKLPFSQDDIVFNGHVKRVSMLKIQKRNFNLPLVKLKVTFTSRFQHTCRFSALSWVSSITLL